MKKQDQKERIYASPSTSVEELLVEGILCASDKEGSTEEWEIVDLSKL